MGPMGQRRERVARSSNGRGTPVMDGLHATGWLGRANNFPRTKMAFWALLPLGDQERVVGQFQHGGIVRNVCTEFVSVIKIDEQRDLTRDKAGFTVAARDRGRRKRRLSEERRDIDDGFSSTGQQAPAKPGRDQREGPRSFGGQARKKGGLQGRKIVDPLSYHSGCDCTRINARLTP
ncbi:uncharacterized protein LOC143208193 [Lasioglossum baleicum]|uniref:uncharacterized protein LOC143208193 n=1 Tax=Lasioglossum baleicum TaxID=434251 RepID=UPI003FCC5C04